MVCLVFILINCSAQQQDNLSNSLKEMRASIDNLNFKLSSLEKKVDDNAWRQEVEDIAIIDKVQIVGPPLTAQQTPNPTGLGAGNPFKIFAYVFIPKNFDPGKKYPLIIFPHGGVHSDFKTSTFHVHFIREMMSQGYILIAPDYRGSTGYGRDYYNAIDYGGLEIEDDWAARNYMIDNYSIVDKNRIGIVGWSHGGLHAVLGIERHPEGYNVAFAGMPVSDLIARMGYRSQGYRDLYSIKSHIGKTAEEDIEEYKRRSPVYHKNIEKIKTPILIYTNTNDEDVNVWEVRHLIEAMIARGKQKLMQYKIYEDKPGGHYFNLLDIKEARESRVEIYKFLAQYLTPSNPILNLDQLSQISYFSK